MAKKHSIAVYFSLGGIWFYKKLISPLLHLMPYAGCRFRPTCSQYAAEALRKHGFFKGILMGTFRILRCNPFCEGGTDNVPDKFSFKGLFRKNEEKPLD